MALSEKRKPFFMQSLGILKKIKDDIDCLKFWVGIPEVIERAVIGFCKTSIINP